MSEVPWTSQAVFSMAAGAFVSCPSGVQFMCQRPHRTPCSLSEKKQLIFYRPFWPVQAKYIPAKVMQGLTDLALARDVFTISTAASSQGPEAQK
jgi:hypothetical protein